VTHQGAACDVASVHFSPTLRRTDILFSLYELGLTAAVADADDT